MRTEGIPAMLLILLLMAAGCTGNPAPVKSTFSVSPDGMLDLRCAPATVSETVVVFNETYTKSRVLLHTDSGDVVAWLGAPKSPRAAAVYAPGAGEKHAGHEERMVRYASDGYAFLFVDMRGNGGETPGTPFGQQLIQQDYTRFKDNGMPQYYQSVCDLVLARKLLADKFNIPVYAMGSSNGGRYAAVAAGTDPAFAGYIGISTSDWGLRDAFIAQGMSGDPVRYASSIEPSTCFSRISPRPVWIFHAASDPIIPLENGREFFDQAHEPKTFTEFAGDHGINPDVDDKILRQWAQIYAPRG